MADGRHTHRGAIALGGSGGRRLVLLPPMAFNSVGRTLRGTPAGRDFCHATAVFAYTVIDINQENDLFRANFPCQLLG